jgi:hypothetical protein
MVTARRFFEVSWIWIAAAVALIALAGRTIAIAGPVMDSRHLELDFTNPDVAQQANWTKSASLKLGPHGLIFEAPGKPYASVDLHLQTEPIAIGLNWQPVLSAVISASLSPRTPIPGPMFVRYSADTKHWSPWQLLDTSTDCHPQCYGFNGKVEISQPDRREFQDLCYEYHKQRPGPPDEEACAQWVLHSQPDFFATHFPFIGYVQLLYEIPLYDGQGIEHLDVAMYYSYGGNFQDPGTAPADTPWRFRAQ